MFQQPTLLTYLLPFLYLCSLAASLLRWDNQNYTESSRHGLSLVCSGKKTVFTWKGKGKRNLTMRLPLLTMAGHWADVLKWTVTIPSSVSWLVVPNCVPRRVQARRTAFLQLRLLMLNLIHQFCCPVTQYREILPMTLLGQLWFSPRWIILYH